MTNSHSKSNDKTLRTVKWPVMDYNNGNRFPAETPRRSRFWNFTFMWLCIVTNFFVINPNRCTNFINVFCHETLHIPLLKVQLILLTDDGQTNCPKHAELDLLQRKPVLELTQFPDQRTPQNPSVSVLGKCWEVIFILSSLSAVTTNAVSLNNASLNVNVERTN
jgi:hypothetical protein